MSGDARALGFAPDRLARIGGFIRDKYLTPGKLPFAAPMDRGRRQ
jgi:hypothetical protein